jgi:hypothetical protein
MALVRRLCMVMEGPHEGGMPWLFVSGALGRGLIGLGR